MIIAAIALILWIISVEYRLQQHHLELEHHSHHLHHDLEDEA